MDVYKFQSLLLDLLKSDQHTEVIQTAYEATTKMMSYETNELKVAHALIDTAHALLYASRGAEGAKAFIESLEVRLDEIHKARTITSIRTRTKAINTINQD